MRLSLFWGRRACTQMAFTSHLWGSQVALRCTSDYAGLNNLHSLLYRNKLRRLISCGRPCFFLTNTPPFASTVILPTHRVAAVLCNEVPWLFNCINIRAQLKQYGSNLKDIFWGKREAPCAQKWCRSCFALTEVPRPVDFFGWAWCSDEHLCIRLSSIATW